MRGRSYIMGMNRRRFLQSLAAIVSAPAMPAFSMPSISVAAQSAATVPANARFWAIYMSGLHGDCTPQALQNMLNISASDAQRYVSQLVADGVIKPNPLLKRTVSHLLETEDQSLFDKIKRRFEMKSEEQTKSEGVMPREQLSDVSDTADAAIEHPEENAEDPLATDQAELDEAPEDDVGENGMAEEDLTESGFVTTINVFEQN